MKLTEKQFNHSAAYARACQREIDNAQQDLDELFMTIVQIEQFSNKFTSPKPLDETRTLLDALGFLLTEARNQSKQVRRSAKAIHDRQEREENGVYRI